MGIPAPAGVAASGQPPAGDQANAVLTGKFSGIGPGQAFAFRGPMNLAIWAAINTALTTVAASLAATVVSGSGLAAGDAINSTLVPPGTTVAAVATNALTLAVPPVTYNGYISTNGLQITGLPSTSGLLGATVSDGAGTFAAGTTVIAIVQAAVPASLNSPGVPGIVELSAVPLKAPVNGQSVPITFAVTANAILAAGTDANATFTGAAIEYSGTIQLERSFDGGSTWLVCNIGGTGVLAQWSVGTPVNITFGEPEKNVLYRLNCTAYTSGTPNYRISQTGGAAESLAVGPLSGG